MNQAFVFGSKPSPLSRVGCPAPGTCSTEAQLRMSRVADAVVLAAGGGRRMGVPKARLLVDGVPLLLHHVRALHAAGLRVTAVLGADYAAVVRLLPATVRPLRNTNWATTDPATSAWLALATLGDCLVVPVDTPPAHADTLLALLDGPGDAVPTWQGRDGHPVRLRAPHAPGRLDTRLLGAARVPVHDPCCVLNLNTPADVEAWLAVRGPP